MQYPYPNPHPERCPWHSAAEMFGAPNIKWCENTICSWISEPANTWSNLAYFIAGALIILIARGRSHSKVFWLISLATAITVMGTFSFLYHATNNFLGQWADFIGMFLMFAVIIGRNLDLMGFRTPKVRAALTVAVFILPSALVPLLYHLNFPFQLMIVVLAIAALMLEFRNSRPIIKVDVVFLSTAAGLFVLAFSSSLADVSRYFCDPHNRFLHGHVMWHILSAAGFVFLALHWRRQVDITPALYNQRN